MLSFITRQVRISLIFWFSKIWQNIFVTPTRIALCFPLIEITFIATNVEHRIQHRRTANYFSASPTTTIVDHRLTRCLLWLRSEQIIVKRNVQRTDNVIWIMTVPTSLPIKLKSTHEKTFQFTTQKSNYRANINVILTFMRRWRHTNFTATNWMQLNNKQKEKYWNMMWRLPFDRRQTTNIMNYAVVRGYDFQTEICSPSLTLFIVQCAYESVTNSPCHDEWTERRKRLVVLFCLLPPHHHGVNERQTIDTFKPQQKWSLAREMRIDWKIRLIAHFEFICRKRFFTFIWCIKNDLPWIRNSITKP